MKKKLTLREKINFYMIDLRTLPGKIVDIFIIILNLLICTLFVIETYPISESTSAVFWKMELVIVGFFIIEYIARIYGAKSRIRQVFDIYSIIDLLAILPTVLLIFFPLTAFNLGFIRILRVFRVLRIFRFLRFAKSPEFFFGHITVHLLKVIRLLLTIMIIFFVTSGFFWHVESEINANVQNFGDAFYYTVVTLATVGFGDIIPLSSAGRWVTILMITSGIVLIPWQASQIVKEWVKLSSKKEAKCPKCGLIYHDRDASHCKSCGAIIYQEHEDNM